MEDADLLARELRADGLTFETERVWTHEAWERAMSASDTWDIVLMDHSVLQLDTLALLAELRERVPDLPAIVVSGTISEELAVNALRAGARDFVMKGNLVRLSPAVQRELTAASEARERRAAEKALRETEADYRSLRDAIPQMVWITRPDGWNIFFNERWFEYTGLSAAETEGTGWSKPFHPDDASRAQEAWDNAVAAGGTYSVEARLRRADGVYRWWLIRGLPQFDEAGAISRWFGTCTDIEDLKQSEATLKETEMQLRQAQKMEAIGLLAGGVAHDFNNLLTVINGYGDMALNRCADDEVMRHSITEIRRAGDRAAELTRQLLAFSRQQVLKIEIVDLNAVISDHMSMLSRMLGEDIELRVELGAGSCSFEGDAGQFAQVLFNIATNARDAMPEGGELLFRTTRVELRGVQGTPGGAYVALEARDTGIGMDAATQERMFEPFFTTKEVGKGTGLGMSTVFGIVEQSRGHIAVESKPGEGTVFHIHLPHVEAPEKESRSEVAQPDNARATETVLLVEDEPMVRALIEEILAGRGYKVLAAASPEHALKVSAEYADEIDLLLTDVVMPEMNGRQLVERIQIGRPNIHMLYISGYTSDAVLARGVLSADVSFLQKPFTASQLTEKVREELKRRPFSIGTYSTS